MQKVPFHQLPERDHNFRYLFNRNGAIVCSRDTLEECLAFAKRSQQWDQKLGTDKVRTEFTCSPVTYKVEEHRYYYDADCNVWQRTYNDVELPALPILSDEERAKLPLPTY